MAQPSDTGHGPVVFGLPLVVLVAAVFLLRPLEYQVTAGAAPSGLPPGQMAALAGHQGMLAVLGGMRSAVASGFWLRANLAWERSDPVETTALIELAVAADERPLYYWLNGARILAYDLPEWQPVAAPMAVRQRARAEHAQRALGFLEKGLRWHRPAPELYVEMANIHLRRTGDVGSAARFYRLAAELPGAPFYAARIHAQLLLDLGRPQEALAWLRQVLPALPADDPAAQRAVVVERIEALEHALAGP